MLFVCCCITFIKYPSLALMGCKWTLGEKYIKIKLQAAWENAFQVPHKDFILISKTSPREHITGFLHEALHILGCYFIFYSISIYTSCGFSERNARISVRARKRYHLQQKINKIATTRKMGSQSCVGWILSLFGFGELCDFILWLRVVFTAFASPREVESA